MNKLLFIVPMPFHEKANTAGAKVINYYIKKFSLDFDVSVLLSYEKNEIDTKIMLDENPSINFIYSFNKKFITERFIDRFIKKGCYYKLQSKISSRNYRTTGLINKILTKSLLNIVDPDSFDAVIVEFPPLVLQSKIIKSKFPNSKLIASIHDVSFQSLERYLTTNSIWVSKLHYYNQFKENELNNLYNFDLLIALSKKDRQLIETEIGKSKEILTITPYFDRYEYIGSNKDGIFFFGAMNRPENEKSIIWFVENVWINIKNKSLKLYIVGGGVKKELIDFCSQFDNIVLTGFVADPSPIFNKCFAMIVPLQYGAGIKIKTLEAFASGIPLISNSVGIEGIEVNNNVEYIHCETPSEWLESIELISCSNELGDLLSENSKKYMIENYNLLESYSSYRSKIDILFNKDR